MKLFFLLEEREVDCNFPSVVDDEVTFPAKTPVFLLDTLLMFSTTQIFGSAFLVNCIALNLILKKGPESSCFNRFFELSMLALSKVTDINYSISGLTKYSKESVHHSMFTCLSIYSSDISNTSHTISTYLIIILNFIICSNIVRQFSYFTFNTINKMFQC